LRGIVRLLVLATTLAATASPWAVAAQGEDLCDGTSLGLPPLTDLGEDLYMGEEGGLYPSGDNLLPEQHLRLGLQSTAQIRALDAGGRPDAAGSIGFLAVGVSNTNLEFAHFKRKAQQDPAVNPSLVLVNGTRPGHPISDWVDLAAELWQHVERDVGKADLSPLQVQAAWIKLPAGGDPTDPFPMHAMAYRDDVVQVVSILKARFPNLVAAYISSRIYGGYGGEFGSSLSREPFAYEQGFGVKWAIEEQISAESNADPAQGVAVDPWIAWGPYLWSDGLGPDGVEGGVPGRSDGLEWTCQDFVEDGIHPSEEGADKVADMLLDHLKSDPTARSWFLAGNLAGTTTTLPPTTPVTTPASRTEVTSNDPASDGFAPTTPRGRLSDLAWLALAVLTGGLFGFALVYMTVGSAVPPGRSSKDASGDTLTEPPEG
jgi:hypothetical protein